MWIVWFRSDNTSNQIYNKYSLKDILYRLSKHVHRGGNTSTPSSNKKASSTDNQNHPLHQEAIVRIPCQIIHAFNIRHIHTKTSSTDNQNHAFCINKTSLKNPLPPFPSVQTNSIEGLDIHNNSKLTTKICTRVIINKNLHDRWSHIMKNKKEPYQQIPIEIILDRPHDRDPNIQQIMVFCDFGCEEWEFLSVRSLKSWNWKLSEWS